MDRRAVVAEAQRTAAEPRGWKGLVWKRHWHWSHLSSDGRGAGGRFLRCAATGGFSVVSPRSEMYAAGSREEKRAGGQLHRGYSSTIVRILQGGGGAEASPAAEGLVAACALLQRGDWLGVRRCPTCPPSNVFRYRGSPPVPPAGTKGSLHPPLGDRQDFRSALRGTRCKDALFSCHLTLNDMLAP